MLPLDHRRQIILKKDHQVLRHKSFVEVIPHRIKWIKFVLTTALTFSIHMTKNHQIELNIFDS